MDSPTDLEEWKKQNEDIDSTTNIGTIEVPEDQEQEDEKQPAQDFAQAQRGVGRNGTAENSTAKVSLLGIGGVKPKGQKSQIACTQDTPQPIQHDLEETSVTLAHVAMVATATVDERAERDTGSGETEDEEEAIEEATKENTDEDTSAAYQQTDTIDQEMDTSQNDEAVAEAPSRKNSIDTEEEDAVATDRGRTRFGLSSSSEESDKQE
eukprot:scaffold111654_cov45-Cyclotella_meneghiniana.AAC.2